MENAILLHQLLPVVGDELLLCALALRGVRVPMPDVSTAWFLRVATMMMTMMMMMMMMMTMMMMVMMKMMVTMRNDHG